MRALLCLLVVQACSGLKGADGSVENFESGMHLALDVNKDAFIDKLMEVQPSHDSNAMKASSIPDDDLQGEDGQMMAMHSEDALDNGGVGEAMQASGHVFPVNHEVEGQWEAEEEDEAQTSGDMLADLQGATMIQLDEGLGKSIDDLPLEARQELGMPNDLGMDNQLRAQPPVMFHRTAQMVVPGPIVREDTTVIDRSTRDVETRMDERPPTYGEKLLVGQAYSAKFEETNGNKRDADGKCRNSRGDIVDCGLYSGPSPPPVVPSLGDLLDGDYMIDSGPCVLKCGYHRGVGRSIQYVSMEIPTKQVHNQTIGCPKTNNGYPFVSCMLLVDDTDECRTTCVFDGSANPLKPQMAGIGSPDEKFDAAEFRSLAHTTYKTETSTGCASRMSADPLVACEVKL